MMGKDSINEQFESNRPRLTSLAYRMLGSRSEAEDAVQDAWLRLSGKGSQIENIGGWLTTVVARVCLDRLRSRSSHAEVPVGAWLPDEIAGRAEPGDPADETVLSESVGTALLVVLDVLGPAERVSFVLHDIFAVPFDEIAGIIESSPDAARQLASRARRRLQGRPPIGDIDLVRQRELVDAFLRAARGADFEGLLNVLHPDVVLRPDAEAARGGAFREETHGAHAVAARMSGAAQRAQLAVVDGLTGLAWIPDTRIRGVMEFAITDDKISAINIIGDVDRIEGLDVVLVGE
jgi:RNA polymerase sigma-70 factor (ECF subfamily)